MRSLSLFYLALLTVLPGCFEDYDLTQVEEMDEAALDEEVEDCGDFVDLLYAYDLNPDVLAALVDGEYYDEAEQLLRDAGLFLTEGAFEGVLVRVDDCLLDG